jgi:exosortase
MLLGGLVALLIVAYWDMFTLTSAAWSEDLYSHGWIVPLFALALLWLRWEPFSPVPNSERWLGLLLLAFGLSVRLFAAEYALNPVDRLSFIPSIFGAFMLIGGFRTIRWAWPALIFLIFMFPLPTALEINVLNRLQRIATASSTFVLQTLGVGAFRSGNLISIPGMNTPMNVAEGCAGLRMATIFGALAVAMAFIIERPWWDKFVILLSAIPIALIVNIVRITVTGLLYMLVGPDNHAIQQICHNYAGLVIMMPLALILLWLELQVLERVTVPVDAVQLRPVGGARGVGTVPVR